MAKQEYKSAIRSKSFIKHALIKLLSEKDYDRITVTEVIEASGISRGTFYSHYKSLDDVLNQISDEEYNRMVNLIGDNIEMFFDPEILLLFISNIFAYIEEDKDYYTKIILYYPLYTDIMKKISDKYKSEVYRILKEKSTIKTDEEANYFLIFAIGGIQNEILQWANNNSGLNAEIVVNILRAMFRIYLK